MTLRRKILFAWGLLLPIAPLAVLAYVLDSLVPCYAGLLLMAASFALYRRWWRCPRCGRRLGRVSLVLTPHCRWCGEEIDFNATSRRF